MTTVTPTIDPIELERCENEIHAAVKAAFLRLHAMLPPAEEARTQAPNYRQPTEEQCKDPRLKNGMNLTPDGVEVLFRLLDEGAGYNSAGRKLSITPSAVKSRKKEWSAVGGVDRRKALIPWLDV